MIYLAISILSVMNLYDHPRSLLGGSNRKLGISNENFESSESENTDHYLPSRQRNISENMKYRYQVSSSSDKSQINSVHSETTSAPNSSCDPEDELDVQCRPPPRRPSSNESSNRSFPIFRIPAPPSSQLPAPPAPSRSFQLLPAPPRLNSTPPPLPLRWPN